VEGRTHPNVLWISPEESGQAIKVDQAALEFHEKASGTFNEELSKGSAPPPHAH